MSPLRGFAVHSKVEKTLEKPAFTQFREFLHDARLAGRPLENPPEQGWLRLHSATEARWMRANCLAGEDV